MPENSQSQSAFISRLPREIRDAIYLELWRSAGLRQHIIMCTSDQGVYASRWRCFKEFETQDTLQKDVEKLMIKHQVPPGGKLLRDQDDEAPILCRRLQSPWIDHWPCGEQAFLKYGIGALFGFSTWSLKCFKKDGCIDKCEPWSSPYIPMLLICKTM